MCKRIISPGVFYIHTFFQILIFRVNSEARAKNGLKWQKIMSVALHIWVSIHHLIVFLLHKYKMMTSPDNWDVIFLGKKWPKMTKKNCLTLSQELYLIWWWFLLHLGNRMISPTIFFHFVKILIFWVFQSSSINTKGKFWVVPHLLYMSLIFYCLIGHDQNWARPLLLLDP